MAKGSTSSSVNILLAAVQHLSRRNAELQEANSQLAAQLAEYKQAEATFQKYEERFLLLAQTTNDGLYDWDLQTNVAWSSDGFHRLFGPTPPPGDMNWWWERIHPEDRQQVQGELPWLLESNRAVMTVECRMQRQDGTYSDIVNHSRIVRDADGKALRVVGAVTDITERKQAERALRENEQNVRRFQEQLRTLHEVGIELDSADSADELCRMAVELGRSRLGFDRLGIWLYEDDNRFLQGTFGTDEYGQTLDERNFRLPSARHKAAAWVLMAFEHWQQSDSSEPFNLVTPIIVHERDSTWPESAEGPTKSGYVSGSGWTAQAAMWDGKRPVGHISADNLIHQRPIAPYQMDLLSLYGTTLGHLYTRKQAERDVREREAHLRAVLDSAPIIVFAANRQGTLTLNAGRSLSQIGVRPGQNVGQSALDLFGTLTILESPDRVISVKDMFSRVLDGETIAGIGEFGQSIFDAHYTPLLDAQGQVQGLVGVAVDITERKRAEEALRLSEKRHSVISGLSSDYAFSCVVLPDGTFQTEWVTDEAYTRITGYHATEIGTAFTLYHPDDAPLAELHVRQVLAGQYVEGEYRIITRSGELKWVRIIREPEWDEAHQRVVRYYGAVEDITERKRSEEALRQREAAQKAAEEASRVKSLFLANMSHELRTPLNAILNFTAFVADGVFGPINAEQAEALRQSVSSAKHLLSLINDILDLTKIEVGLMDLFIQQVDVNQVLEVIVSLAKGLVKDKPLELDTSIDLGLPVIFGDERRIRQIFLNLISNAVKFTPRGTIGIVARRERDTIHVAVSDTGIGIAPEDQALIFDSFKQAPNDLPETVGTGLGLPISKFFAEAHGGTIWLESEVGKGSTFHVMLPIQTEEQARQGRPRVRLSGGT